MARNYNIWFVEDNSRAYLDSGSKTVHDGHGHDLYRYHNGNLLPVSGEGALVIKSDGRILDKQEIRSVLSRITANLQKRSGQYLPQCPGKQPEPLHAHSSLVSLQRKPEPP